MTIAEIRSETITGHWLRLILVGVGTAIVPLDTAVNIAFPAITHGFGLPISMIQWVVICYVLTYAGLMLGCGRAGDLWGHARVFRIGLLWSTAAFLLCASAPTYGALLFFRFLQGIGAGLVISVAPALVTGLYPEIRRSHALGIFTVIFALASALGPLVGGVLVAHWGWPAVFWFRAPLALVAAIFFRGLPRPALAKDAPRERLDIVGAALLALFLSTLLLSVNAAQHLGEGNLLALPMAVVWIAALIAFLRWEARFSQPIIRLELFRMAGFAAINLGNLLVNLMGFSVMLFGAFFLTRFTALPLPAAGAVLATSFVGMAVAARPAAWLIRPVTGRRLAAAGAIIVGIGLFSVGFWHAGSPLPVIVGALLVQGFGLGLFQVAYMDIVMATLPPHHRGLAGSLSMLTRTVGTVSGATVLTLVFHLFENARRFTGGGGRDAAFLVAFHAVFHLAGLAAIVVGLVLLPLTRKMARPR